MVSGSTKFGTWHVLQSVHVSASNVPFASVLVELKLCSLKLVGTGSWRSKDLFSLVVSLKGEVP